VLPDTGRALAKTRALFVETIGNPVLDYTDIKAVAKSAIAHLMKENKETLTRLSIIILLMRN
jgi:cystathionine beta-lyase/cystathionine gamma-synthase